MIDTLASIMNIRIAMKTNSKINALRNLPVIKRIIPQSLYRSRGLKGFLVAYAWLSEFLLIFLWKMLYYFILVVIAKLIAMEVVENNDYEVLMHFLIFFPVIGMVLNNNTITVDEDTYCSIFVLRINAKKYMLSQYLLDKFDYVLGTLFVGGITICIVMKQPFYMLLCYVLYSQSLKWIYAGCEIKYRGGHIGNPKADSVIIGYKVWFVLAPLFASLIMLFLFKCLLPGRFLIVLSILTFSVAVTACRYMFSYGEYRKIYKSVVRPDVILESENVLKNLELQAAKEGLQMDTAYVKKGGMGSDFASNKDGYAFFNEMFMRRHKKILMKPAIRLSIVLVIALAFVIFLEVSVGELKVQANKILLNQMPVFLFIMYSINSGKRITEAMFANCDNAMLNYRFYRQAGAMLKLFTGRLKYIIFFNMLPTVVLACGVEIIFVISGGADNIMDHIVIFVSIIVMSVFFSTHNIVLYYLLQPYTAESTTKNPLYGIMHFMTYMVCYVSMTTLKAPTRIFCPGIILFSLIYIAVALLLVYHIAPKTFRLRR